MTEGANVESSSPGDDITIPEAPIGQEVMKACIKITDQYRSGVIEKVVAILELQEVIPKDDETIFCFVLAVYVKVVDGYERLHTPGVNPTGTHNRDVTADSEGEECEEDVS